MDGPSGPPVACPAGAYSAKAAVQPGMLASASDKCLDQVRFAAAGGQEDWTKERCKSSDVPAEAPSAEQPGSAAGGPVHLECRRGTFQDVSDLPRAEQAEAANRAKSEFLSRMSHELRTPLNTISGFGQLLAMEELEPQQAEHVEFVLKGASHMLALVDDVLDFSRIEASQLRVSNEAVSLVDAVRYATALVASLAAGSCR